MLGDHFKKIRDTKGTFPAKMGTIKGRNGMDLTKAEEILKRWQEYTEELYKKDLHDPENHYGLIIKLEPDAVKVLHSICQQIWKTQQWSQDWKRSVFIPISERQCRRMLQLPHNCIHFRHYKSNAQNSSS